MPGIASRGKGPGARGHVPVRTCVACGAKGAKFDLVRLALDPVDGLIRVDARQQLPGRGAYVCAGCRPGLRDNKRLRRAFRCEARGLAGNLAGNSTGDTDSDSAKPADDTP